ncbi:MAG: hypothetical protein EOP50_06950, partial [Sphingobacteriales bacterium]
MNSTRDADQLPVNRLWTPTNYFSMTAVRVIAHNAGTLKTAHLHPPGPQASLTEEMYRFIVENCHEGIWVTDAEDCTMYVNRQLAE